MTTFEIHNYVSIDLIIDFKNFRSMLDRRKIGFYVDLVGQSHLKIDPSPQTGRFTDLFSLILTKSLRLASPGALKKGRRGQLLVLYLLVKELDKIS